MSRNFQTKFAIVGVFLLLGSVVAFGAPVVEGFNPLSISNIGNLQEVQVLSQSGAGLEVKLNFSGFDVQTLNTPQGEFQRISLRDRSQLGGGTIGSPELPMIARMIAIPANHTATVEIEAVDWVEFDHVRVYPRQTPTRNGLTSVPSFNFDADSYASTTPFPDEIAGVGRSSGWMGQTVAALWAIPFRYSPINGKLEVFRSLILRVRFTPGGGFEPLTSRNRPEIADKVFKAALLNPPQPMPRRDDADEDEPVKMLVVLRHEALATIMPLVEMHNNIGHRTLLWEINDQVDSAQIKDRIRELYQDGLEYVLLVGDGNINNPIIPMPLWEDVDPAPPLPDDVREPSETGSDSWFACLDGVDRDGFDDHIPEIAISRLVYNGPNQLAQLQIQVAKIIDYTTWSFEDQDDEWLRNSIFIAHREVAGRFIPCSQLIIYRDYELDHPRLDSLFGNVAGVTNATVIQRMNAGTGFVNYRGHGSEDRWDGWNRNGEHFRAAQVAQLQNRQKPFILVSSACETADVYDYNGECLLESFQKRSGGSVSAQGAIITSFNEGNTCFDTSIFVSFFEAGIYSLGYASNLGVAEMVTFFDTRPQYPGEGRTNARTYLWLGDAALQYRLATPTQLSTSVPDTIPQIARSLDIVVMNSERDGFRDAIVTLRADEPTFYQVATSNAEGIATFNFDDGFEQPTTLYLTAWNREAKPVFDTIMVVNGLGVIEGRVTRLQDNSAVEGAQISASRFGMRAASDANGNYRIEGAPSGDYQIMADYPGFIRSSQAVNIRQDDTVEVNFQLAFSSMAIDTGLISINLEPESSRNVALPFHNSGNGTLDWQAELQYSSAFQPFESVTQFSPSLETGDLRLNGVAFADGYFFVAGGNNNTDDNYIYVFDPTGLEDVERRITQPEGSNGNGIHDLAYDGNNLFGACDTTIWEMTLDGDVVGQTRGPYWPNTAIAIDNDGNFWIGNNRALIAHVDREGNVLGTLPNADNVRGLAWINSPDGFNLLVYTRNENGGAVVHGVNPESGESTVYRNLGETETETAGDGLEASTDYDPTQLTLLGLVADGEARYLRVWHLIPRMGWIDLAPEGGSINAGQDGELVIGLNAVDVPLQTSLEATVKITNNGQNPNITIPVTLSVSPNSVTGSEEVVIPNSLAIAAVHPNPFNGRTSVEIDLPLAGGLRISVYDLEGRLVNSMAYGNLPVGRHTFTLTMDNLPSGVYLLRTEDRSSATAKKIVLLR